MAPFFAFKSPIDSVYVPIWENAKCSGSDRAGVRTVIIQDTIHAVQRKKCFSQEVALPQTSCMH
jgi:hypothetical protein